MKNWIYMLLLAATAFLAPVRGTDVGELLPVELIMLTVDKGKVVVSADTGDFGTGRDAAEAMKDLQERASGEVFLETADYLLLADGFLNSREVLKTWFRPGTLVYAVKGSVDASQAVEYLRSRSGGVPLNRLGSTTTLETIIQSEGGMKFEK